jgi:hypothetical protein
MSSESLPIPPSPERPPLAPYDPPDQAPQAAAWRRAIKAIELVRQHESYGEEFHHDAHELTDLLSHTMGAAPACCPDCEAPRARLFSGHSSGACAFR